MAAVADVTAAAPGASPVAVAGHYAAAGDTDQTFAWLERAYAARTPQLVHVVGDPSFGPIRSDPRYRELLRRMGLPG